MNPIGGFFELEIGDGVEYHGDAIRLNSGRNAFEYILGAKRYRKVYLPFYTCSVMLQPIARIGASSAFYHVNEQFEPVFDFTSLREDEAFVYVNYFGLFDEVVVSLAARCSSLIVDNAQAFYARPVPGVDTFYSPRKFFGVPDGAYLYANRQLSEPLERDESCGRCEHLLRRIDDGPEDAYPHFLKSDVLFDSLPLKSMSNLTRRILRGIDYDQVARRRVSNFRVLHEALKGMNSIDREPRNGQVPMVYPFLGSRKGLRDFLISRRIYVARYWPSVLELVREGSVEYEYAMNLAPLPVDQRYGTSDMEVIVGAVTEYEGLSERAG
ncbi:MAG: hypothetical protein WCK89_03885 [bacterium]